MDWMIEVDVQLLVGLLGCLYSLQYWLWGPPSFIFIGSHLCILAEGTFHSINEVVPQKPRLPL
jgi:hypothetical protein